MANVKGQKVEYTSPSGQERSMPHHKGAKSAYQNSDNSRLFIECHYGGRKYTEEWEIPWASSSPRLLGGR
jgi:hypothetical protein